MSTKVTSPAQITSCAMILIREGMVFAFAPPAIRGLGVAGGFEMKIEDRQDIINIDGGAIALGHPLGASGARITGKLATLMQREKVKYGLATMCIGGGQGVATILEKA